MGRLHAASTTMVFLVLLLTVSVNADGYPQVVKEEGTSIFAVLTDYTQEPGYVDESTLNISELETTWEDDGQILKSTEAAGISAVSITSGTKIAVIDPIRGTVTLSGWSLPTGYFAGNEINYKLQIREPGLIPSLDVTIAEKDFRRFATYIYGSPVTYCVEEDAQTSCSLTYNEANEKMSHLKNWLGENMEITHFTLSNSGRTYYLRAIVDGSTITGTLQTDTPRSVITVVETPKPYIYSFSIPSIEKGEYETFTVNVRNTGGDAKYCYFSASVSPGLEFDISHSSVIDYAGVDVGFFSYPPGSALKNRNGDNITSQYELLDVRISPGTAGPMPRFRIALKAKESAGRDEWIEYRYTCTTPTADPADLIRNKQNYPASSQDTDQQGWDVYEEYVSVFECDQNSDCGSAGWSGSNFCKSDDVYRKWMDPICHIPGGTSSFCEQLLNDRLIEDCGDNYCTDWSSYCSGEVLYRSRTCHDRGCSSASCFDTSHTEQEMVENCGMEDAWYYTGLTSRLSRLIRGRDE